MYTQSEFDMGREAFWQLKILFRQAAEGAPQPLVLKIKNYLSHASEILS